MSVHSDNPFMATSLAQTLAGGVIAFVSLTTSVPQWIIAATAVANMVVHLISAYRHWHRRDDEKDS